MRVNAKRGERLLFTEIVVFGIVWGVLFIYFLHPRKSNPNFKSPQNISFYNVFKSSLITIVTHKKAILSLIMLIITLAFIWSYYIQLEWYNQVHAIKEGQPRKQAIHYMVSILIYSVLLYIFLAIRRTLVCIYKPR